MAVQNPSQITFADARLMDDKLAAIGTVLTTNLTWLTTAYGKAQRLVKHRDGNVLERYPAVPATGNLDQNYLPMFPDASLGNYCFWDMPDPQKIEDWHTQGQLEIKTEFGLVLWFDLRTIYTGANWKTRTAENVKYEVLEALRLNPATTSNIIIKLVSDRVENIYPDYDHKEIKTQFLMRPYGGFRLEGELEFYEDCN